MQEILLSVITGAIGSFLVVFTLFRLKPKLEISSEIAKEILSSRALQYSSKIVNRTPYPLYDIKIQLFLGAPQNVLNGNIKYGESLMTLDLFEIGLSKDAAQDIKIKL